MSIQITEATALRLSAAFWLLLASGGPVSTYILTSYPPDQHPVAKLIGVVFGVLGIIGIVAQTQAKPLFHTEGPPRGPGFPMASALLALLLLPAALAHTACDQSQIQKAVKTSDRVVELCDRGGRVIADLKAGALIDAEDVDRVAPLLTDVRTAALELGNVARSLKGDEPDAKERIRAAVLALASAADRLNEEGVLRIKNPQTREKLRKALAIARVAADVGL